MHIVQVVDYVVQAHSQTQQDKVTQIHKILENLGYSYILATTIN